MAETPNFGFDPKDVKFIEHLDRLFERLPFESYRISYINTVIARDRAVLDCLSNPDNVYRAMKLSEQNNITFSHFLYYMDALFAVPVERTNRAHYIVESFTTADISQQRLNNNELIYEPVELRTKIEEVLLADTDEAAKQDIVDMYQRDIHAVVEQFINKANLDDTDL
jgi:hypothetical protein